MFQEAFGYGQWVALLIGIVMSCVFGWMGWVRKVSWANAWKWASIGLFLLTILSALVMWNDAKP